MGYYKQHSDDSFSRVMTLLVVILMHVVALYVFAQATNFNFTRQILTVMHAEILPPDPPRKLLPPPPPEALYPQTDVIQIIPAEVRVEAAPVPSPIQYVDSRPADNNPPAPVIEEPAGLITPPRAISGPHGPDRYPHESLKAQEAGRTQMRVCISIEGLVESAEVTHSSGYPRLDKAAVEVAMDTRFKPAMRLGKPLPYCINTGISFGIR